MRTFLVGLGVVDDASVRLHLGEVGQRVVAIDAELGLDAEHDPAGLDQLLELGRPAVIDIAAGVLADLVVVDVLVHQNAGLDTCLSGLGVAQDVADHFLGRVHVYSPNGIPKLGGRESCAYCRLFI